VSEFVDFTYYGEVIPAGLERPPRDVEEPRLWTLTDDTSRALSDNRTQSAYAEYLHIGYYAFFDSCANAAISEGMDTLSNGPPLSAEQAAAVALIRAGHRTHPATEEAARTRLGFLRLTKGRQTSTYADRVFAELAHERSCRPRPTAVSGPLDALRQAFVDRTLQVSLHTASKVVAGATFAKITLDKPPGLDAIARKAAADRRKAAAGAAAAAAAAPTPPLQNPATPHGHNPRNDGVARRADSCSLSSPFMRHRVRRRWREWERIGASGQVLSWIRHGVRVKFN
jgi:hypothetical protein